MHLLFNKFGRRMTSNEALTQVQSMGFLTAEEHAILATEPHEHAVGIWSWHFQTMLKVQKSKVGMIPIQRWDAYVNDAMGGAQFISQRLRRQIPYSYISLIALFVKSANLGGAAIFGCQIGRSILHSNELEAFYEFLLGAVVPLLMNCVLLLNTKLDNPLTPDFTSLSQLSLGATLERSMKTTTAMAENLPAVIKGKWAQ